MMKLRFESELDFQRQAVDAVCDLFLGQEVCQSEFTVIHGVDPQEGFAFTRNDLGVGNLLSLLDDEILALEEPLKFIFSHSALREGWDNPNVFQICALRDIQTERERRQTIGRGLRLCVNQDGKRLRGFEVNTLTVVARESYEEFAENLQREIEEDTGIRFGAFEPHQFALIPVDNDGEETTVLGFDKSQALFDHLRAENYIDAKGQIRNSLRTALEGGSFAVPQGFVAQRTNIVSLMRKLTGHLDSAEFRALWDRIKHKTTYRVYFDNKALLKECATALLNAPAIHKPRLQWRKAGMTIGQASVEATEIAVSPPVVLDEIDIDLPDLPTELQDRTQITRRSIHEILVGSRRLDDFKRNPQQFIELVEQIINRYKKRMLVDGIKYQRIGDESCYAQELLEHEELTGYLKNMVETGKSVYDKVIYESDTEALFAAQLEKNTAIKVYTKLPGWFRVPTPLGSYNPDWAVLMESDSGERLYLVVETKASTQPEDLRLTEATKIECGRSHIKALAIRENPARFEVASTVDDLLASVGDG